MNTRFLSASVTQGPRRPDGRYGRGLALALGAALSATVPGAAAPSLTISSALAAPNGTAQVPVLFQTEGNPVAVQFDVAFDAARMKPGVVVGGGGLADHTVASSSPAPGRLRVVVYSLGNTALNSGQLVILPFTIAPGAPAGTAPLVLSDVILAKGDATRLQPVTLNPGVVTISLDALPSFKVPVHNADGSLSLELHGQPGRNYTIQWSDNLTQWQDRTTGQATAGVLTYKDTETSTRPRRFYRALLAP